VLKEDLIQDIDHLLELFDIISDEKAFIKPKWYFAMRRMLLTPLFQGNK